MPFSENVKLEVKRKAHYKCCICESFGSLEIHHIIPQGEGGSNEKDNAVPLCPNCHEIYGDNPKKRKWIKEKRDFWYEFCRNRLYNEDIGKLEEIYDVIIETREQYDQRLSDAENTITILQNMMQQQSNYIQGLNTKLVNSSEDQKPDIYAQMSSATGTMIGTGIFLTGVERDLSMLGHAGHLDELLSNTLSGQIVFFTEIPEEVERIFNELYPNEPIQIYGRYTKKFLDLYTAWKKFQETKE